MTNTEHQKGVALLFALGILSLILVMGLAFLGNSLISQKIAFNSQESSVSRFLARSAVDRALAHLTLFNLIQARDHATYYAADASSVFSRISTGNLGIAGEDQTEGTTLAAIGQDQLSGNDSKLNVEKKYDTPWYWGKNSAAKWIYVHQNGVESAGDTTTNTSNPIVARYAYQVLPQTSLSRISLYGVTSGANSIAGTTPAATNPRIPHFHRWGADVDELIIPGLNNMFLTYWGDENSQRVDGQYEFDNFINLLSSSNTPNPFYGSSKDVENRKRWLRNIFVEGKGRVAREAYSDGYNWYPRFNLGKHSSGTDPWYSRFLRSGENDSNLAALRNSAHVLDRLTAPAANSADCKFDDSKVRDNDYLTATTPNPIGLPFLRSIGDSGTGAVDAEIGAFPSVESLRKQIAANLNDYCDEDSIPTSDVAAAGWGGLVDNTSATPSTLPSFTGNEKTPYVNEIGFEFKLNGSTLDIDTGKYVFKPGLKGRLLAELIGIYRGLELHSAELYGKLNSLSVTLKVSIRGKVDMQYTKSGESTPTTTTADFTEGKEISVSTDFSLNLAGGAFTISDFVKNPTSNYWMGRKDLTTDSVVTSVDFSDKIRETGGAPEGVTVSFFNDNVTHVKVEVTDVKFNLGNLALKVKDKETNPTVDGFVDFVRVDAGVRHLTGTCNLFNKDGDGWIEKNKLAENTAETVPAKGFFYVGSMQAIDSRQNLFAKLDNVKGSDWFCSFEPSFGDPEATHQLKWDALNKTGRVNVGSAPDSPSYANSNAIAVTARDAETTKDPAWQGDAANQHISTAVIRNAPMRSPWELGFIHRGIPFQTINLKKAGGIDGGTALDDVAHDAANFANWTEGRGTRYEYGDAGILDQIKMTEFNKSYGKIDMRSLLVTTNPDWWISAGSGETVESIDTLNRNIFKSLFENMRIQAPWRFLIESAEFETAPAPPAQGAANPEWYGAKIGTNPVAETFPMNNIPAEKLRSKIFNNGNMTTLFVSGDNDAAQEERIGKVVNLIEAESNSLPNVFRIVVVVQNIRDFTGSVVRLDSDRVPQTFTAMTGRFDANIGSSVDNSIYYDEILGESRMLVTVEKIHYMEGNTPRARLRVKQIEYLD